MVDQAVLSTLGGVNGLPKGGYFTYDKGMTQADFDKNKDFYSKRGEIVAKQDREIKRILAPFEQKADENAFNQNHEYDANGLKVTRIPGNKKYGVADKFIIPGKDRKTIRILSKNYPENVPADVGWFGGTSPIHFGYNAAVRTFTSEYIPPTRSILADSHGHKKMLPGFTKWSKDTVPDDLTSKEKKLITKYGNRLEGSFRLK